jgi:hypothetical protein
LPSAQPFAGPFRPLILMDHAWHLAYGRAGCPANSGLTPEPGKQK